jgi:hypothetical protein
MPPCVTTVLILLPSMLIISRTILPSSSIKILPTLTSCGVISKIERAESLVDEVINDIIQESAGIMVARGDLGVEIGDNNRVW